MEQHINIHTMSDWDCSLSLQLWIIVSMAIMNSIVYILLLEDLHFMVYLGHADIISSFIALCMVHLLDIFCNDSFSGSYPACMWSPKYCTYFHVSLDCVCIFFFFAQRTYYPLAYRGFSFTMECCFW